MSTTTTLTPTDVLDAYVEAFARGDHDAVADLFAPDGVCEIALVDEVLHGREAIREQMRIEVGGVADVEVSWLNVIVQGDTLMAEGDFSGYLLGAGETFTFRLLAAMTVRDGKITRLAEHFDTRPIKPSKRMRVHGPPTRRSPYWEGAEAAGQQWFIVYNHMYFPLAYRSTPYADYVALTERVALWDVGCERQTQLKGPDALRLLDYIASRDMSKLEVGQCRYTILCDTDGQVLNDPVVLRIAEDTVWISHGDVDVTLWAKGIAMSKGWDVEVSEPDVAPIQVQGPNALDTLRDIVDAPLDELRYYRCVTTKVAGIDAVVSRTGWSGGAGYEVYPFDSTHAMELWNAVLEAGAPHGIKVTGANPIVALERGVTDMAIWSNLGSNPFENGMGRVVDLDGEDFVGRDALVEAKQRGIARQTVGLVFDGRIPNQEGDPWPVRDGEGRTGFARWANFSFGLRKFAALGLIDSEISIGAQVTVDHGEGVVTATVVEIPLVK